MHAWWSRKSPWRQSVLASAGHGDLRPNNASRADIRWLALVRVAVAFWLGAAWTPGLAGQIDYGAALTLGYESNITRSAVDPRADSTPSLIGGLGYTEHTTDVKADVVAQIERRTYAHNTYPNETLPFLNAVVVWSMVPQSLTWTVEDVARTTLLTFTVPDTPTNRVNTNSLSTGPQLSFRTNPKNTLMLGARYGRYDVQGPGDNERYSGYGGWLYKVSELDSLSLNYVATRVDFAPPSIYTNFLRQDQFLVYKRVSGVNSLVLEGGTTNINRYGGQQTSGRLARLTAIYGLNSGSAVRMLLSDSISDSATDLIRSLAYDITTTLPPIPSDAAATAPLVGANLASPDIYRSQRAELTYVLRSGHISSSLQGSGRRVDYVTLQDQDYNELGGRLALAWTPSETLRVYVDTLYSKRTFSNIDERDTDRLGSMGVTYRLTRGLFVSAEGGRADRESNIPLQSYVDKRLLLTIGYSTGPLYSPFRR